MSEVKTNLPIVAAMMDGSILVEVSETEVREPTEAERDEIARRCNDWPHVKELVAELAEFADFHCPEKHEEQLEAILSELKIVLEGEQ